MTDHTNQRISTRIQDEPFFLNYYKIHACTLEGDHDILGCPCAHPGDPATRRDPNVHPYVSVWCPEKKAGQVCPRGDSCKYSHNMHEYWLHPRRFRTQMCRSGPDCKRTICFFAHSQSELRTPRPAPHANASSSFGSASTRYSSMPQRPLVQGGPALLYGVGTTADRSSSACGVPTLPAAAGEGIGHMPVQRVVMQQQPQQQLMAFPASKAYSISMAPPMVDVPFGALPVAAHSGAAPLLQPSVQQLHAAMSGPPWGQQPAAAVVATNAGWVPTSSLATAVQDPQQGMLIHPPAMQAGTSAASVPAPLPWGEAGNVQQLTASLANTTLLAAPSGAMYVQPGPAGLLGSSAGAGMVAAHGLQLAPAAVPLQGAAAAAAAAAGVDGTNPAPDLVLLRQQQGQQRQQQQQQQISGYYLVHEG